MGIRDREMYGKPRCDFTKYMITTVSHYFNPIPGGYFMYVRRGGWGKFAPTLYFPNMHVMSMKIGMDVFNHLHFQYLIEKISGKVHFSLFSCSLFLAVLRVLQ